MGLSQPIKAWIRKWRIHPHTPAHHKKAFLYLSGIVKTTVSFANLQVQTQPIFALFEGFTSSKVQCTGHVGEPAPTL
jgi:hypothetical protein